MKWNRVEPINGTTRHLRKFLWWPVQIDNQTRWLEYAVIYQRYVDSRWLNIAFQ
jgi:hypothetical protein